MTLVSAGWNEFGQLGRTGDPKVPLPIDFPPSDYLCIAVGQLHSIIINKNGEVYGWGSNEDGGLGFTGQKEVKTPQKIELKEKAIWAASGYCNTVILAESGNVYAINEGEPVKLDLPEPCIYVSCGYYLLWSIGRSGAIYQISATEECRKFEVPSPVVQMDAGNGFAVALTSEGEAYGFGDVTDGSESFLLIESLKGISVKKVSIFNGHCIAVSCDGKAYVWGNGGQGKLGLGSYENVTKFTLVKSLEKEFIVDACAGCEHSCFVTKDGSVYGTGSNENGQLFVGPSPEITLEVVKSSVIKGVVSIEAGNHTIAIINGKPIKRPGEPEDSNGKTKGNHKDEEEGGKQGKSNCCLLL